MAATLKNIFSSGIELTDDELASLPHDVMMVWLEMWEDARDQDAHALRQAEEGRTEQLIAAAEWEALTHQH